MFSEFLNAILRTLDVGRAPIPRVREALKSSFEREARRALSHDLRVPPLSERRAEPKVYAALQRERRRDLEALLLCGDGGKERVLDILCAICEESRWAEGPGAVFEDETRPEIDLQAADTAALLGWAWHLRGAALGADGARVHARLLQEARRRVLQPLVACDDYLCSTAVYCAAVTALLLLEDDRERLFRALKPLLRRLDAACACAERERSPLPERLTDACALADLAQIIRLVSAGAADLTREAPGESWLDEILFAHVQEDWFFTCAEGAVRLELSGAAIYRLGCFAGDGALRALGAAIHRARALPSPTCTGRLLDASLRAELEEDFSPAPRLKHAALEDGRLMLARGAGFFCGLTSGGDRANVGDICLFLDRACVLSGGNLPLAQLPHPLADPLPDWDFSDASRAIMGVDVTHAYAADEGVRAHQRTLMLSREEYGAQLVDVFDLSAPRALRYAFHSPFAPEFFGGGVRLGPMLLSWEGKPVADARRLEASASFPEGQWEIALTYPEAGPRAMFTFFMRHA